MAAVYLCSRPVITDITAMRMSKPSNLNNNSETACGFGPCALSMVAADPSVIMVSG